MWEIRIEEQNYSCGTNQSFHKERQEKLLMGNIKTLNEAKKYLADLFKAEDAKELTAEGVFHSDNIKRKKWTDTRKQEYIVFVDYVSPDIMRGTVERVYLKFYKSYNI